MNSKPFLNDVLEGLSSMPKTLPCKYLYDEAGCRLFTEICNVEEYYLTDLESSLLKKYAPSIEAYATKPITLLEFGSGDAKKSEILIANMTKVKKFIPLDICREELEASTARLQKKFPKLEITPICGDFTDSFPKPKISEDEQMMGFFSGSTIGNLDDGESREFLRSVADCLGRGGFLLLSADLVKGLEILSAAYNDKQGRTASFNLNLLRRINRELDADFDLKKFSHVARWNGEKSRMEMHLVSLADQEVSIGGRSCRFDEGETIHTENSRKYSLLQLRQLAEANRWRLKKSFTDAEQFFSLNLLECPNETPGRDAAA